MNCAFASTKTAIWCAFQREKCCNTAPVLEFSVIVRLNTRMMLALVRDIVSSGRVPGGSTLTQQLARNLFATNIGFTTGDRSW